MYWFWFLHLVLLGLASAAKETKDSDPTKNFDCKIRPDGNYADPEFPCSSYFISCELGITTLRGCTTPGARYDSQSDDCLMPEYVVACNGTATSPPPTTTAPAIIYDCTFKLDGNYENPDEPCSQLFVTCATGSTFINTCPANLYYDIDTNQCIQPIFIVSCGGSPATTTESTTTEKTTTASTTAPTGLSCEGREIGSFADPDKNCSERFFTCIGAKTAIEQFCQPETYYDTEVDRCTFFNKNPDCTGIPRTTAPPPSNETTTTEAPTETTTFYFDCFAMGPGNHGDPFKNCSDLFIVCTPDGRGFEYRCTSGTFYDRELNQCLYYNDVPDCSGTPRPSANDTVETTTTEPETTTTAFPTVPPVPFDCSERSDGNYPVPDAACSQVFFQCANNVAFSANCPGKLRYSARVDACLGSADVPGCPGFVGSPCDNRPNGFYPDPTDCKKFLFCVDRFHFSLNCPVEHVFSPQSRRCLPKKEVPPPCGNGPVPPELSCDGVDDGLYAHSDVCNEYYQCENGERSTFTCQEGYAFNQELGECDMAAKVPGCAPQTASNLFEFCAQRKSDGIYSYPENCHRSVVCVEGFPFVFICDLPNRPDFNPITKSCEKDVPECMKQDQEKPEKEPMPM